MLPHHHCGSACKSFELCNVDWLGMYGSGIWTYQRFLRATRQGGYRPPRTALFVLMEWSGLYGQNFVRVRSFREVLYGSGWLQTCLPGPPPPASPPTGPPSCGLCNCAGEKLPRNGWSGLCVGAGCGSSGEGRCHHMHHVLHS